MSYLRYALGAAILVLLAPIFSVIAAGLVAQAGGCILHEGNPNPCIIGGIDWGDTLYTMAVMGWFALATLPLAGSLALVWLIVEVVRYVRIRAKRQT